MSRRACTALICLVLAGAAFARPQYDEPPHHDEYRGDEEHRGPEYEHEHEHGYEPNYYPREEYNAYDNDEHYVSLTLQEVKIQDLVYDGDDTSDFSYKAFFTCGEEKESAKECAEASRDRYRHGDHDFLQNTIMPDYVASCNFHFTDVDPDGDSAICWGMPCVQVDMSCSIYNSAKKCGCPLEPGFSFNATGSIDVFSALSCSQSYLGGGLAGGAKRIAGSRKAGHGKAGHGKQAASNKRALLADNTAEYFHPYNQTVYAGTAVAAHARVTASAAGYNYEANHQLKHAKVVYVGAFLNGAPVSAPEEGNYYDEGSYRSPLPFITPGLLKLIVKK